MMDAARTSNGDLSMLRLLLQHSANPDLQSDEHGRTALMISSTLGQEAHVRALLKAGANTALLDTRGYTALQYAEAKGHTAIAELIRQHAPPPCAQPAAPSDASEPTRRSLASLPEEILASAGRGELQKVVRWLRKGGQVDALGTIPTILKGNGRTTGGLHASLLYVAAANGHLEIVRELLKRGANVDLQRSVHGASALMGAAGNGHLSIVGVLLQHSANPGLQNSHGFTALQFAEDKGHTATAELIRQRAAPRRPQPTAQPDAGEATLSSVASLPEEALASAATDGAGRARLASMVRPRWVVLSLVLGAIASVAFRLNLTAVSGQHRAAQQKRPRRPARYAEANGRKPTTRPVRQHTASPQPAATAAPHTIQAEQAARAGRAKQPPALEVAIASAPREVQEGGEGAEARAQCERLLATQRESERKAKQESAAEAARLAAAEQAREVAALVAARAEEAWVAAREAVQEAAQEAQRGLAAARVAAASKAREVAVTAAAVAAAAEVEADTLERAATDGGEGGSSGTASLSEASKP